MEDGKIEVINQVISKYFEHHPEQNTVPVKALMPDFIAAGVFAKDVKKGMPIRKVLRNLDEQNALNKIPSVHAERKDKNTFWYFLRAGTSYISEAPNDTGLTKKQKVKQINSQSDENYLINLCDELLGEPASRQHKFSFILGDYHKDGKTLSLLPLDAYYEQYNLVLEFVEPSDGKTVDHPNRKTISGITRAEQKNNYQDRKRKGVLDNDMNLIEIKYGLFGSLDDGKLARDKENDLKVLGEILKDFLSEPKG